MRVINKLIFISRDNVFFDIFFSVPVVGRFFKQRKKYITGKTLIAHVCL